LGYPRKFIYATIGFKGEIMTENIARLADGEPLISQDMANKYLAYLESLKK